jgi:hypothetical protein
MTSFTKPSLAFWQVAILSGAAAARAQDQGLAEMPSILDQEYARIAEQVPGFGGLYLDDRGTTHVYLQDLSYAREVQYLGERVEVHQGDYAFRDLQAWKSEARGLLSRPGILALDIDEARNRLVIVAEAGYALRLRLELRELLRPTLVPVAAVLVDAGEPRDPDAPWCSPKAVFNSNAKTDSRHLQGCSQAA